MSEMNGDTNPTPVNGLMRQIPAASALDFDTLILSTLDARPGSCDSATPAAENGFKIACWLLAAASRSPSTASRSSRGSCPHTARSA